jgi:hypothetical protein
MPNHCMNILDFETLKDEPLSEEEFEDFVEANKDGFIVRWMVDGAQAYSDLAFNYLEAAFVGQECLQYAERISFAFKHGIHHNPVAEFGIKPTDAAMLAYTLHELYITMTGEDDDYNLSHMENMEEFQDGIHKIKIGFPELVDDYLANRINGEYYQIANDSEDEEDGNGDFLSSEFNQFPERQFGFWQVVSAGIENKFYASTEAWIIPPGTSLDITMKEHSGIDKINFEKAELFAINHVSYLISKGLLVHFSFDIFLKAKACAYSGIQKPPVVYQHEWMDSLLTFRRRYSYTKEYENIASDEYHSLLETGALTGDKVALHRSRLEFLISEFGDQVLIKDDVFQYVIWRGDQPKFNELLLLNQKISDIFMVSAQLAGIVANISLPWDQLDDEHFEQLCVDILFYNPSFNPDTIRKMGKSRSRDSGRDIEIWTHARPNYQAEKFIFQCKFLKPGSSLTATKMLDISDTVDQFGASGYGVMTNVVIDPTLYDKLDRLALNKGIRVDDYSVYKLERILARYPAVVERHFKNK